MRVTVAKSGGFCVGVKRALRIARATARAGEPVCMLGDIVHNEDVVRDMAGLGVRKIRQLRPGKKRRSLLIRAHGVSRAVIEKAHRFGYDVVDATCPMVKDIHKIVVRMERAGYTIVVIGDRNHDEVQGIVGQLDGDAIVIDRPDRVPRKRLAGERRLAVVSQSTQNEENVSAILGRLWAQAHEVRVFNTICGPTHRKQAEGRRLPVENDVMIVIGSKTSANTRRLFEIAKALNERTYWVRSARELEPAWFEGACSVGVISGASTPDATTQAVIAWLRGNGK